MHNDLSFLVQWIPSFRPRTLVYGMLGVLVIGLIFASQENILPFSPMVAAMISGILFLGALARPWWFFLAFCVVVAFEAVPFAVFGNTMIRPYQAIGAILGGALIIRFVTGRLPRALPRFSYYDALIGVFALGSIIAVFFAADTIGAARSTIIMLTCCGWYVLGRYFIRGPHTARIPLVCILGSGVIVSAYGIWQNWAFLHGMANHAVMPGRPNSVFPEPDWLGIFCGVLLALVMAGTMTPAIFRMRLMRWSIPLSGMLITLCMILTVARSAWVGVFVCVIVWIGASWFLSGWRYALRIGIGAMCIVGGALFLAYNIPLTRFAIGQRVASTAHGYQTITVACATEQSFAVPVTDALLAAQSCRHILLEERDAVRAQGLVVMEVYRVDPSANIRAQIYRTTVHLLLPHWWSGVGWGQIAAQLGTDADGTALNTSNLFLEVWAGSGILGLCALLVFLGDIGMRALYRGWQNADVAAWGSVIVLASIVVPNFFNAGIYLGFVWVLWGGLVSILSAQGTPVKHSLCE